MSIRKIKLLSILPMLVGCHSYASEPTGEQVFNALLFNADKDLNQELLCQADASLGSLLTQTLSPSFASENKMQVSSECSKSKIELSSPEGSTKVVDVWDCQLQMLELDSKDEFVSSSMLAFALDENEFYLIDGSLRCL